MSVRVVDLPVELITRAGFAPFGTLLEPAEDGKVFGPDEAQLVLDRGTPRYYILNLKRRELAFTKITRHMRVTQCLAAVGGAEWLMAVAPPDDPDNPDAKPDPTRIKGFRIPGDRAIALHRSTWHAGPFFQPEKLGFFNLELADTNQVDHYNCSLDEAFGLKLRFAL